MDTAWRTHLAGAAAGAVNGLFGGGGGMVFLPMLSGRLEDRKLFPTCVAVIFPICCVSALVYLLRDGGALWTAVPYLLGGAVGGFLGGRLYRRIPTLWLRRIFGCFLLYGAWRYLQ